MSQKKVGILGCGRLNGIAAQAISEGVLKEDYVLVGGYSRTFASAQELTTRYGGKACATIEELLELKPDYILEAANPQTVKDNAEKILSAGVNLVTLSIGGFADADFYQKMQKIAKENGVKIHIPSGAISGLDLLRTASLMSDVEVQIRNVTGPQPLARTGAFDERLKFDTHCEVFNGSAKEAIEKLPCRVNVAIATSLASAGHEKTRSVIESEPGMVGDIQEITVKGEEINATLSVYSRTAAIAGWSVVALLQNLASPVEFF